MYKRQEVEQKENLEIVQYSVNIHGQNLRIIFLYRSNKYSISTFKQNLQKLVQNNEQERNLVIIGDMNEENTVIPDNRFSQLIDGPTTSGIKGKTIDHAYARIADFNVSGHVLYKCFVNSYHHPICVNLKPKSHGE